ncbi:long-chain-fatty-acid--CoA ligase 4-like [Oppia nitens]|uniref:long-chain-fatty-acid--CoA ligase 4-like n=1 Tax=Oppia nitens TaxID=1686743 RepID=UPI0023D9FD2E|nr:long-chain-fatty-acid--CoA ligase 4-like [Oppia nitens]
MSNNLVKDILIHVFMFFTRLTVTCYTYLTLPVYYIVQKPAKQRTIAANCGGHRSDPTDPDSQWVRNVDLPYHPLMDCCTIADAFDKVRELYPLDKQAIGYRDVLAEEIQMDSEGRPIKIDGKVLRKYRLSDYKWMTLGEVSQRIDNISRGLMATGIRTADRVAIYSETSAQYFLMSAAIGRMGAVAVTVFHTLSDDGVVHALNETEVKYLVTSYELIKRLAGLSDRLPKVETIIYFEGPTGEQNYSFPPEIKVLALSSVENAGQQSGQNFTFKPLDPKHECLIMYTSGTSGLPKGVIATQAQLKEACMAMATVVRDIMMDGPRHTYIAYLPQAHILEATIELFLFLGGVKIGFGTPFTLNETAPGLAPGTTSDIQLLKPTIMTTVPLVLDRIRKEMYAKLASRTPVSTHIFNYLINYKSHWIQKGYNTPIVNTLLCGKVREQLGGRLEYMVVGSAPLSQQLQSLIKCSVNVKLIQGYGTTETCGAVLCMDFDDLSYGRVGGPLNGVRIKLKDWAEGGYSVADKPHPRGEIVVGGHMITNGYFKLRSLNDQSFYTDSDGLRWFMTGDIGEIYTDGTVRIIDRKKDLIKLSNGEFVSLGKIEACLKNDPFIDNACVVGDAIVDRLVALIQPNPQALSKLCRQLNIGDDDSTALDEICANSLVVKHIHQSLIETSYGQGLNRREIPTMITVCHQPWTPDNGLLTGAMKLKRVPIMDKHRKDIDAMFAVIKGAVKLAKINNM